MIALLPNERLTGTRLAGLVVGFGGVLVVLGIWNGLGQHDLLGDLMCIAAAACYAVGFPYARRFLVMSGDSPVSLAAAQTLVGTVEVSILAFAFTAAPQAIREDSLLALAALGALGTGIAYILNWSILRDAGATVATMITYALPVVAVVAGVVLLGEALTWNEPAGAVIIVMGALLTQGQLARAGRWITARFATRTITS